LVIILHKKHSEKRVKAKVEKKKKRTALQMQKSHGISSRAGTRKDSNGFVANSCNGHLIRTLTLTSTGFQKTVDEILTYGYVKPRDLWFRPKRPPTDPSRIVWGLYPSGMLACTLKLRNLPEPEHAKASAQGSELARASRSQSAGNLSAILGTCLAYDANQGPGTRRHIPSHRGSGAPRRSTLGAALPAESPMFGVGN
jgi:hypothetical protein